MRCQVCLLTEAFMEVQRQRVYTGPDGGLVSNGEPLPWMRVCLLCLNRWTATDKDVNPFYITIGMRPLQPKENT